MNNAPPEYKDPEPNEGDEFKPEIEDLSTYELTELLKEKLESLMPWWNQCVLEKILRRATFGEGSVSMDLSDLEADEIFEMARFSRDINDHSDPAGSVEIAPEIKSLFTAIANTLLKFLEHRNTGEAK